METTIITWKNKKWTLTRPVGKRFWDGVATDRTKAVFVQGSKRNFICLYTIPVKPRNINVERRQKDMGPDNPEYHWDWMASHYCDA